MNYFKQLQEIIEAPTPQEKIEKFSSFYDLYKKTKDIDFTHQEEIKKFSTPSYHKICHIVSPQDVPKRTNLTSKEGQINLLHAILHIEYSAIDLALDGAYRFDALPREYYDDWLEVAEDEIRHFVMLEALLKELGSFYGDVVVHNALFEASQKTQTLIERMAVVPRYLEANGLDATPMILQKIKRLPQNEMLEKIQATLKVILEEEIDHVKKGDKWFAYACKITKSPKDIYFEIIQKYYPRGFLRSDNLNIDARKEAGFSCDELYKIAKKKVCE
ncbi:COG2833: uncharacterized protein [hydrothermal vent metagenome]|uniref:COG2833: uncharacterized protein n=1 Tax=hydrothermal vent metagenome TaxID=652676 RepID=A0A1W1D521_9ZZZZ